MGYKPNVNVQVELLERQCVVLGELIRLAARDPMRRFAQRRRTRCSVASYLLHRLGQSLILLLARVGDRLRACCISRRADRWRSSRSMPGMSQADLARIAHQMGLDRPLPMQYWEWFQAHCSTGDWGRSYRDSQPVLAVIGSHLAGDLRADGAARR